MDLDLTQRLLLYNHYELLKRLDPGAAHAYARRQAIVAAGLQQFYPELTRNIEPEPVPEAVTREVVEILNVFRALEDARLRGVTLSPWQTFVGFHPDEEPLHHRAAEFLLTHEGKWGTLHAGRRESQFRYLPTYRKVVESWRRLGLRFPLTEEDVRRMDPGFGD